MGQSIAGEVERLRKENEELRQEIEKLKIRIELATYGGLALCSGAIAKRYGDDGLAVLRDAVYESELPRQRKKANKAGVRAGDGTIEDWIRFEEMLCEEHLLEFETECTPERGVVHVTKCPGRELIKYVYPEACRMVFIGAERATAEAINPNLTVRGGCYLPEGAETCDIICEWKSDS